MPLIPLVVILGPTAAGKTRLAIDVALRYGGEVVSADSMQIYRGMDIGTAKPTPGEMHGVPHHMLDIIEPSRSYSVADYVAQAKTVIADIHARGRLPVLAGGTGLYIDSLTSNLDFGETERDEDLRTLLREQAEREGGEALLGVLRGFDPDTAAGLHPNNLGRIIRAIEVYRTTGLTMTELRRRSREVPQIYRCCKIGLCYEDRAMLYERINRRVDLMMEAGLLEETKRLLEKAGAGSTAIQAIGYKELALYLGGEIGLSEAVESIKRGTRRYAKRQMTWFRRDPSIEWIEGENRYENICKLAYEIIDNCDLL